MRRCWLSFAAALFCAAGLYAEPPGAGSEPDSTSMPGTVVSGGFTVRPPVLDRSAVMHTGACTTCADGCGSSGHGIDRGRIKEWFQYRSFRPGECTDTPTGYQPSVYAYFPCKSCNNGSWAGQCVRGDARLFQVGLPPAAPFTAVPGEVIQEADATPGTPNSPKRTQGPLMPGSAVAAAQGGVGTAADPSTTMKVAAPYSPATSASGSPTTSVFRPVPVYVPVSSAKPGTH